MFNRHQHTWLETRRTFAPPLDTFSTNNTPASLIREMSFGITTIELVCRRVNGGCGDIKTVCVLGDARDESR